MAGEKCPHCAADLGKLFGRTAEDVPAILIMAGAPPLAVTVPPAELYQPLRCTCGHDALFIRPPT